MLRRELRDATRLPPARVVLPEPALRRKVLSPLPVERQRTVVPVNRDRARSGRIHPDADDLRRIKAPLLFRRRERAFHALLEAEEVIARMLAREVVVFRVEQNALFAAGIIHNAGAEFRAVGATHDQRAHRVGAVINAEGE